MPLLNLEDLGGYIAFQSRECRERGLELAARYRGAEPFPHVVIDHFLSSEYLKRISADFPDGAGQHFLIGIRND